MNAPRGITRKCALCKGKCKHVDWCFGCKHFVCAKCDNPVPDLRPHGPHEVNDHAKHWVQA